MPSLAAPPPPRSGPRPRSRRTARPYSAAPSLPFPNLFLPISASPRSHPPAPRAAASPARCDLCRHRLTRPRPTSTAPARCTCRGAHARSRRLARPRCFTYPDLRGLASDGVHQERAALTAMAPDAPYLVPVTVSGAVNMSFSASAIVLFLRVFCSWEGLLQGVHSSDFRLRFVKYSKTTPESIYGTTS